MTEEHHDIPPWFMPNEPQVIGEPEGDAEEEHFEETGELLADDVCPHCGEPYEKEEDGRYIHDYRPVDGEEWGDWQETPHGLAKSTEVEPAEWCTKAGRQRIEQLPWDYDEVRHGW